MPIHEEEPRGLTAHPGPLLLPGLERMRAYIDGRIAAAPIGRLTGLRPTEASLGAATYVMPSTPWLANGVGMVDFGTLAFLADSPFSSAVITGVGPGVAPSTAELSMSYFRWVGPPRPGTNYVARATVAHFGKETAYSQVMVQDPEGRVLAQGSSRLVLAEFPVAGAEPAPAETADDPTDPFRRPPKGSILAPQLWAKTSGLELLQGFIDGTHAHPPIAELMGLTPLAVSAGESAWTMPASGWFASPGLAIYGGAIAFLAQHALDTAVLTTLPAGALYASLDLKVQFLRPVAPGSGLLTARGQVIHRGKRIFVASATITSPEGKVVALATGSVLAIIDGAKKVIDQMASELPPATE